MPLGQRVADVPPERRRSVPAPAQTPPRRRRSAARAEGLGVAEKAARGCGSPSFLVAGDAAFSAGTSEPSSVSLAVQEVRPYLLQKDSPPRRSAARAEVPERLDALQRSPCDVLFKFQLLFGIGRLCTHDLDASCSLSRASRTRRTSTPRYNSLNVVAGERIVSLSLHSRVAATETVARGPLPPSFRASFPRARSLRSSTATTSRRSPTTRRRTLYLCLGPASARLRFREDARAVRTPNGTASKTAASSFPARTEMTTEQGRTSDQELSPTSSSAPSSLGCSGRKS
jgi:hypothetical protein